jgi:aminoglycoside/choline kinase family phosphotransferase
MIDRSMSMAPFSAEEHPRRLAGLYRQRFGVDAEEIEPIRGDGSDRLIFRVRGGEGTVIGIHGANLPENRAFLGFSAAFGGAGLPVPRILAVSDDGHYYLEDDFGDELLFDWQQARRTGDDFPDEVFSMYVQVLRDLVRFQFDCASAVDYTLCYQSAAFDLDAMRFDVRYFREMFLDHFVAGRYDAARFDAETDALVRYLDEAPRECFLYRDFQSRNVLILDGPRYIDYQSGRRGAFHYDAASMLCDARPRIPGPVRERLLDAYLDEVRTRIVIDAGMERERYYGFAVLRVMQALGAFGNLGARKGKTRFLYSIAPALDNLAALAETPGVMRRLPYLRVLFASLRDDDATRRAVTALLQPTSKGTP